MLGVDVLAPYDTDKIRINKRFGGFFVQSFQLPHGETNSYGFLIRHLKTNETLIYITDAEYCPFVFKASRIDYFLIECNYQKEYIDLDAPNKEHKLKGHCSLDTCREFVKANISDSMQNIILCHLGLESTNAKECVSEIEKVVNSYVFVDYARPNTVYQLGRSKE